MVDSDTNKITKGIDADRNIKRQNDSRRSPRRITEAYLHNAGLHYLQRFAASTAQFRKIMRRKIDRSCAAHADQDRENCLRLLETLIDKFRQTGLLNDESYLRGSIFSLRRRGLSARMITAKLTAKGLPATEIAAGLRDYEHESHDGNGDSDSEFTAALALARRKKIGPFRPGTQPRDDTSYRRAIAVLSRAGFGLETVRRVLGMEDRAFDE